MKTLSRIVQRLIRGYKRFISPFLPMSCRFHPSCSEYAWLAIAHYGMVKGLWKTVGRLLRCHPWSDGGYDPVLPNKKEKN